MARSTRRKYWKRKSGRWAANIKRIRGSGTISPSSDFVDYVTVAQNPDQEDSAVSQVFRVKNIEIACQLEATHPNVENIEYYIMYVPEGYPLPENGDLPIKHPEWIMAYKYIGSATNNAGPSTSDNPAIANENAQVPRITTRLTRKLQSGDQIVFMVYGRNTTATNVAMKYSGLLRWWTKAN